MAEEIRIDNTETLKNALNRIAEFEKENAELRRIAGHQQSSNMDRFFENEKLKEGLAEQNENFAYPKAIMRKLYDNGLWIF